MPSLPPVARVRPSGLNATLVTHAMGPCRNLICAGTAANIVLRLLNASRVFAARLASTLRRSPRSRRSSICSSACAANCLDTATCSCLSASSHPASAYNASDAKNAIAYNGRPGRSEEAFPRPSLRFSAQLWHSIGRYAMERAYELEQFILTEAAEQPIQFATSTRSTFGRCSCNAPGRGSP